MIGRFLRTSRDKNGGGSFGIVLDQVKFQELPDMYDILWFGNRQESKQAYLKMSLAKIYAEWYDEWERDIHDRIICSIV